MGEEESAKEGIFRTPFCIPLFINSFDQVDMGFKDAKPSYCRWRSCLRTLQRDFKLPQDSQLAVFIPFANKKIKLIILNH